MVENLKVTKLSNGDSIPNITDGTQWSILDSGAWSGFTGLAGGYRAGNGVFYLMDRTCYWWTSTSGGTNIAMSRHLNYNSNDIYGVNYDKKYAYSVRCIKD